MANKIYYKIKLRICEVIDREEKLITLNEGYVIITDKLFQGYLTLDYIEGFICEENQMLSVQVLDYEPIEKISGYLLFSGDIDFFELPGEYILQSDFMYDNRICYLIFESIEKDPFKQREIDNFFENIKKVHNISPNYLE